MFARFPQGAGLFAAAIQGLDGCVILWGMKTNDLSQAEARVARLRSRIGSMPLHEDAPAELAAELSIALADVRRIREGAAPVVGPYSGLTRAELAKTGTCETDWA